MRKGVIVCDYCGKQADAPLCESDEGSFYIALPSAPRDRWRVWDPDFKAPLDAASWIVTLLGGDYCCDEHAVLDMVAKGARQASAEEHVRERRTASRGPLFL